MNRDPDMIDPRQVDPRDPRFDPTYRPVEEKSMTGTVVGLLLAALVIIGGAIWYVGNMPSNTASNEPASTVGQSTRPTTTPTPVTPAPSVTPPAPPAQPVNPDSKNTPDAEKSPTMPGP